MDELLIVLCIILHLVGIAGCVLPIIPGPLVSFVGLWLLTFTSYADFSTTFILIFLAIALIVLAIDFVVPIWGTKRYGGSKEGTWGATIGLVIGAFFFPPFGIILGPFLGAFIVEILRKEEFEKALRAGVGSLVGFLLGTGLKLMASFAMLIYFLRALLY